KKQDYPVRYVKGQAPSYDVTLDVMKDLEVGVPKDRSLVSVTALREARRFAEWLSSWQGEIPEASIEWIPISKFLERHPDFKDRPMKSLIRRSLVVGGILNNPGDYTEPKGRPSVRRFHQDRLVYDDHYQLRAIHLEPNARRSHNYEQRDADRKSVV